MAFSLHGGLLIAFADQITAATNAKIQTEISILDLPSVSGTTRLDVKRVERILPKATTGLKPIEETEAMRLKNSPRISTTPNVMQRPVASAVKDSSPVHPVTSTKAVNNHAPDADIITARVESEHEASQSITSKRIAISNSSTSIAPIPQPKNTKAARVTPTNNAKRAQPTAVKIKISKTIPPNKKIEKINTKNSLAIKIPISSKTTISAKVSKETPAKARVSKESTIRARVSKEVSTISSRQNLKTIKIKSFNPTAISANPVKPNIKKPSVVKRINRITTGKLNIKKSNQLAPKNTSVKVAMLARPRRIAAKSKPQPTNNQVDGFGKVVNFLKFYNSENPCFLAIPTTTNQRKIELSGFSNIKNSWPRFQKALAQNTNFEIAGRLADISNAQCQVMTFVRQSSSYPSYSISMQLDYSSIKNSEFITGKLFIDEGRYLNLILIDDEGTAININKYVNIGKNASSFQFQVNLTNGEVSTSQLLLAIVTDKQLNIMRSHASVPAPELLQNIKTEIDARNTKMDLALTAFEIK